MRCLLDCFGVAGSDSGGGREVKGDVGSDGELVAPSLPSMTNHEVCLPSEPACWSRALHSRWMCGCLILDFVLCSSGWCGEEDEAVDQERALRRVPSSEKVLILFAAP
jgi:hypothetical protein